MLSQRKEEGIVIYYGVMLILILLVIAVWQILAQPNPQYIYVAVKEQDNGTVLVWAEYPIKYGDKTTDILVLNGTMLTVKNQIKNLTFIIEGKEATPVEIHPAVTVKKPLVGVGCPGDIDILYKVKVDYS